MPQVMSSEQQQDWLVSCTELGNQPPRETAVGENEFDYSSTMSANKFNVQIRIEHSLFVD